MSRYKVWLSTAAAVIVSSAMLPGVVASAAPVPTTGLSPVASYEDVTYLSDFALSPDQQRYFDLVVSIGEHFEYDRSGDLILPVSDEYLVSVGFTSEDVRNLRDDLRAASQLTVSHRVDTSNQVSPNVHVSNNTLYISNHDLKVGIASGIATAAAIGPAALQAAFISLGALMGGPVGFVITVTIAALGAPSMVELGGRILWALRTGQGIYIKPVRSYPPVEFGYW